MKIAGVIIAGGRSRRMGMEKAFVRIGCRRLAGGLLEFGGVSILSMTAKRLTPQVTTLMINANGDGTRFRSYGLTVIPDLMPELGTPLAGLHAGLRWAREEGFDAMLSVPSDCPFLPGDLAKRLGGAGSSAAVAASAGQTHFLTGLWSQTLLEALESAIAGGLTRVQDWVRESKATAVEWSVQPFDPFFNVNTPEDLAEADRIGSTFGP